RSRRAAGRGRADDGAVVAVGVLRQPADRGRRLASFRLIDESRNPVAGGFDVPGAVTGTAGLGALVFALVRANVWGWGSAQTLLVLAAAAVLLGTFVRLQLRGRHPLVPPRLFRSR